VKIQIFFYSPFTALPYIRSRNAEVEKALDSTRANLASINQSLVVPIETDQLVAIAYTGQNHRKPKIFIAKQRALSGRDKPYSARRRSYRARSIRKAWNARSGSGFISCETRGFPGTEWVGQDAVFKARSGADLGIISCLCWASLSRTDAVLQRPCVTSSFPLLQPPIIRIVPDSKRLAGRDMRNRVVVPIFWLSSRLVWYVRRSSNANAVAFFELGGNGLAFQ
jgi:hypothetical protein